MSLADKSAELEYNKNIISDNILVEKINEMGFEASFRTNKPTLTHSAFIVRGMTDNACVHKIETKVASCTAVKHVKVSLDESIVRIIHNFNEVDVNELCKIISDLGFSSELITCENLINSFVKINVDGMTCHSCVNNIEDFVGKKQGVAKISVSLKDKIASIWYDDTLINAEELRTIIEDMGFEASINEVKSNEILVKCYAFRIQSLGVINWTTDDEDALFFNKGIIGIKSAQSSTDFIIYYLPDFIGISDIINVVQSMGFMCYEKVPDTSEDKPDAKTPVHQQEEYHSPGNKALEKSK